MNKTITLEGKTQFNDYEEFDLLDIIRVEKDDKLIIIRGENNCEIAIDAETCIYVPEEGVLDHFINDVRENPTLNVDFLWFGLEEKKEDAGE